MVFQLLVLSRIAPFKQSRSAHFLLTFRKHHRLQYLSSGVDTGFDWLFIDCEHAAFDSAVAQSAAADVLAALKQARGL